MSEGGASEQEVKKFINEEMEYARKFPHIEGCAAELSGVFSEGKEFSKRYSDWLLETNGELEDPSTFFNQVIPYFLSKNGRQDKSPLQSVVEFYLIVEHYGVLGDSRREKLIKKWPWIETHIPEKPLEDRVI